MKFSTLKQQFTQGLINKPVYIKEALTCHQQLFDYTEAIKSTSVQEIQITADGVKFLIGDEKIILHCPLNEARVAPVEILNFDQYEPAETRLMEDVLSNCHTMLDIGANIGWYSAYFAHRYPQLQIHAFEPMPETFTWLTKNIAANHLSSQVTLHNFGLSDSTGPVKFHCYSTGGTNASLKNVSEAPEAVTVSSFTKVLDEWSQENSVVPDFIKCDVEGAELLVFLGGEATLRKHTPVVFTELLRKWSKPFGYHPNDVLHFFSELGYLALAVNSEGVRKIAIVDNSTLETNYLFLHEINHATLLTTLLEA